MSERLAELWRVVNAIPKGKVATYGEVGRLLENPATGRAVGRWMAQAPPSVCWWRVVAKGGRLAMGKRDPMLAREQMVRLRDEGVEFLGDQVAPSSFWTA